MALEGDRHIPEITSVAIILPQNVVPFFGSKWVTQISKYSGQRGWTQPTRAVPTAECASLIYGQAIHGLKESCESKEPKSFVTAKFRD